MADSKDSKSKPHVDPQAATLKAIETVFGRWSELPEQVKAAAQAFRFVAENINPSDRVLTVSDAVAWQFEPLCLWLRKTLPSLAPEVKDQAIKVLDEFKLEQIVATLHSLGPRPRRFVIAESLLSALAEISAGFMRIPVVKVDQATADLLSEEQLHNARIGLSRLAGMLEYAAKDLEDIEDYEDLTYKSNFNPKQVDREHLVQTLSVLADQLDELPEGPTKKNLLNTVQSIREEVRRPKPRWRSIIAKTFILIAVLSDLRGAFPATMEKAQSIAESILQTVMCEAQVEAKKPAQLPGRRRAEWLMQPRRIGFRPADGDGETTDDESE